MINIYPKFSSIDLSTHPLVNTFTSQFEPYSDFNATSLLSWDIDNSIGLSMLNGNLIIRLPDYITGEIVYSILGVRDIESSIDLLLSKHKKLHLVPEIVVNEIQNIHKYKINEERNNFDYVFETALLSKMIGGKYKKKRNKHNVFVKDHKDFELLVKTTDKLDIKHTDKIKEIDREWAKFNAREDGDILAERKALDNILSVFSQLNLILVEIIVDGEIKAFSINEVLNDGYAICHFEKALLVHHENIFTFLTAEVASILQAKNCSLINWEQDLGLAGLRRSKKSYHPTKMLKKYSFRLS